MPDHDPLQPRTRRTAAWLPRSAVTGVLLLLLLLLVACAPSALVAPAAAHSGVKRLRAHVSVVGGTQAAVGTWPFMAFVADEQDSTACSGTVVSAMLVLTAAHCAEDISDGTVVPASAFRVVTGALDWTHIGSGQVLSVSQVLIDPTFDATTLDDDAALLVLASPTTAPAIGLAGPAEDSLLTAGTPAEMAGWGYTYAGETTPPTSLYWGSTVVQSTAYCTEQETLDGVLYDPAENICAADDPSFAVAACHGDSGGPLVATADGTPVEIGIASHGDPGCSAAYPSVFTRADAVSGWVSQWISQTPAPGGASSVAAGAGAPASASATASPPSPPAAATAPKRPVPASPGSGGFAGATAQRGGRLALTVGGGHVSAFRISFALHCGRASRTHLREVVRTRAPVILANGAWSFTDGFRDARDWRYTIHGTFTSPTRAAGTLSVRTRNGACSARDVRWSARAS
jgi:secreted trypsin-like serine protease